MTTPEYNEKQAVMRAFDEADNAFRVKEVGTGGSGGGGSGVFIDGGAAAAVYTIDQDIDGGSASTF